MIASDQFIYTQEPNPTWQQDLDRLWPGEHVSRLVLHWLAGLPTAPVQRWAIWEILPRKTVLDIVEEERKQKGEKQSFIGMLWNALQGPDPRTLGHWASANGKKFWRTKSVVSREQWDLHRAFDGLPFLSWIVEGVRGGHSWQFGAFEQNFLLATGATPDMINDLHRAWPIPGSQPYADYDQRTFKALSERDLLRQWRQAIQWDMRTKRSMAGIITDTEATERREEMVQRMLHWLDNQISDVVSDIPRKLVPQWSDFLPTMGPAPDVDGIHMQVVNDSLVTDFGVATQTGS